MLTRLLLTASIPVKMNGGLARRCLLLEIELVLDRLMSLYTLLEDRMVLCITALLRGKDSFASLVDSVDLFI